MDGPADADTEVSGELRTDGHTGTVRIEGRFPVGIEDVWSALTDPGQLARWLGEVRGDLRPGGTFRGHYLATDWAGTGRIEACEPPRRLLLATSAPDEPDGVVELTLTAAGGATVVVLQDSGLPLDALAAYGAGDQIHVEDLGSHLTGGGRCDARARWAELMPGFRAQQSALPGAGG